MTGDQRVIYFDSGDATKENVFIYGCNHMQPNKWWLIRSDEMSLTHGLLRFKNGVRWDYNREGDIHWTQTKFDYMDINSGQNTNKDQSQLAHTLTELWANRYTDIESATELNSRLTVPVMFVALAMVPFLLCRASQYPIRYLILSEGIVVFLFYVVSISLTHSFVKNYGWSTLLFLCPHLFVVILTSLWSLYRTRMNLFGGES